MCKFCEPVSDKSDDDLVELPYFHKGIDPQTGIRLVRAKIPEEIWNLAADMIDGCYTTLAYFCPRCGRQLMKNNDQTTEADEVTEELDYSDCYFYLKE